MSLSTPHSISGVQTPLRRSQLLIPSRTLINTLLQTRSQHRSAHLLMSRTRPSITGYSLLVSLLSLGSTSSRWLLYSFQSSSSSTRTLFPPSALVSRSLSPYLPSTRFQYLVSCLFSGLFISCTSSLALTSIRLSYPSTFPSTLPLA